MKKFILKSLLFIAVFFVLDKAFLILRHKAPQYDFDQRINRVLEGEIDKDLLIFGSSRGTADISTWMFEDSLGLSAFNLSYGGAEIEFEEFILSQVVEHCPLPKYIIKLVDDDFELHYHAENSYRADRLYPLVDYPEVRTELVNQGELNPVASKLFVLAQIKKPVYDFSKPIVLADTIIQYGNMPKRGQRKNQDWTVENINTYSITDEVEAKKEAFMTFQKTCLENNITLVLTIPPSYRAMNPAFAERIEELILPGVHFHPYDTTNESYREKASFKDRYHLNRTGSDIYTAELLNYLRNNIIGDTK